jgi:hypothetical protein
MKSNLILANIQNSKAVKNKEFCNRGRGLSAASLGRLQATPPLQTSLVKKVYRAN